MPYRRVWVSCVSLWVKMLSLMFLIFWKRVCLGMRKLVQWRKKCIVDSISLLHSHKGFKVSWKQCVNLCSWRWPRHRRNLVKSLIPRGFWILKILLALCHFKSILFKSIETCWVSNVEFKLVPLWYSWGKKCVFKIIKSYFHWVDVIAEPGIVNPVKIRY